MWNSCVITWDGSIVPCCFDKDAEHTLGNISEYSFESVWKNETYNKFRQTVLESRSKIEMCKNCTEGTKVWS
jgi:radical SAM protein with 4Fe4S-binding SPASM domain